MTFIFLALQSFLAFRNPKAFLWLYFLYTSAFLGFISNSLPLGTFEVGMFFQSLLMLLAFLGKYSDIRLVSKKVRLVVYLFTILYAYGLIWPVLTGTSSILQSIVASKEFSTIFLLHYLIANFKKVEVRDIFKILTAFSYYFIFILLIFMISGYYPPQYFKTLNRIEFYHPTLLSLFLFIVSANANSFRAKVVAFCLLIVWSVVMIPNDHTAILATTLLGCMALIFKFRLLYYLRDLKRVLILAGCLAVISFFLPIDTLVDRILQDPSFQSRQIYNAGRIEKIQERPLMGYGFLHKSALTLDDNTNYMESLSFIDSGYIDLLGKFGLIGMLIYLVSLGVIILRYSQDDRIILSIKIFIAQFYLINITWSVFSFSMGLICIALSIFILEKRVIHLKSN